METIKIDAGYANGWDSKQRELVSRIENYLRHDCGIAPTQQTTGRCVTTYTYRGEGFEFTYKVDSSD